MAVLLKIDGQTQRFDSEIIAIGRAPSNQIALPHDTRLAPVHAVFRLVAGRWIVESRDGGPIRVGTGRPTQFSWLNSSDVVHLTETGPDIEFSPEIAVINARTAAIPPQAQAIVDAFKSSAPFVAPAVQTANAGAKTSSQPHVDVSAQPDHHAAADRTSASKIPPWITYAGTGELVAAMLIGLGGFLGAPRSSGVITVLEEPASARSMPVKVATPVADKIAAIPAADPRRALYCLELRNAAGNRTVQIGTAWAITSRKLVTTGDAARGMALNQEFFPTAFARHTLTGEEFEIAGMTLHPKYESAAGRLEDAVREIKRLQSELERVTELEVHKKIEAELAKFDSMAIVAADESVNVNIAILDVTKDSPMLLSVDGVPLMKAGQKITLAGHRLSPTKALADPDNPTPVTQHIGILQHAEMARKPATPSRCLVSFDQSLTGENWSGSPVLSADGSVIGVYARPTPPPPGVATVPLVTHDVTVIDGIRDWLPKVAKAETPQK